MMASYRVARTVFSVATCAMLFLPRQMAKQFGVPNQGAALSTPPFSVPLAGTRSSQKKQKIAKESAENRAVWTAPLLGRDVGAGLPSGRPVEMMRHLSPARGSAGSNRVPLATGDCRSETADYGHGEESRENRRRRIS